MATLVKIDRKSIKRNPRAHSMQTQIMGEWMMSFKTVCTNEDIERIEKLQTEREVVIMGMDYPDCNGLTKVYGLIETPDFDVTKLPGKWDVESNRDIQVVHHLPESEWFYKYQPTKVQCENCKRNVLTTNIETDCNDDGCWDICPYCNGADTFDFELEDIYKVVKEIKA